MQLEWANLRIYDEWKSSLASNIVHIEHVWRQIRLLVKIWQKIVSVKRLYGAGGVEY